MDRFWSWADEGDELRLTGAIASEAWYGDKVTPGLFRDELERHPGDITVYINSPGGDVFAASEIYTMLMEHKGEVTVKIDALAASAASVIAMAGGTVLMAPTAYLMIHDPSTVAMGDEKEMKKAIRVLAEIKEGLINAYELKTGMSRDDISALMAKETWLNAYSALELGFADGILGGGSKAIDPAALASAAPAASARACVWAQAETSRMLVRRIVDAAPEPAEPDPAQQAETERLRRWLLDKGQRG